MERRDRGRVQRDGARSDGFSPAPAAALQAPTRNGDGVRHATVLENVADIDGEEFGGSEPRVQAEHHESLIARGICAFRTANEAAFKAAFVTVLQMAQQLELTKLGVPSMLTLRKCRPTPASTPR